MFGQVFATDTIQAKHSRTRWIPIKWDFRDYWKQHEVWSDINAAYERFFEVNPDATGRYYQYALYAYKCEQWTKFIELIPIEMPNTVFAAGYGFVASPWFKA